MSLEEIEATIARADDKERNIGLIAAPLGAVVDALHFAPISSIMPSRPTRARRSTRP